jgi:hypothetical protein
MARFVKALPALALCIASCSPDAPPASGNTSPPPNAGTLLIHAQMTLGACYANGYCPDHFPLRRTAIVVRSPRGDLVTVATDRFGDARVRLAPGRYFTRLAPSARIQRAGDGEYNVLCGAGDQAAHALVTPRQITRVEVTCAQP